MDMSVEFECHVDYSIYEIIPKKGTHPALGVKQKGKEADIFNGQIMLVFSKPAELRIELIVRSNEFLDDRKPLLTIFWRAIQKKF